ncbi:MAG: helix-turn-helix domain-containing protein [Clostridiales bacterium]|nr:helix-turn-helix domain-containing protein [Clostridiales bacterium]
MANSMTNFGEEIKYQRLLRNKTILQVERDTGINNANLSRWENGKVIPRIDFCVILADYYGITLDELIGREINKG